MNGNRGFALCLILMMMCVIGLAAIVFADDHNATVPATERRACEHYAGRPCILTFTRGTLTGISWYDTERERNRAMRRQL